MPSVLLSLLLIIVSTVPSTYYLYHYPSFHSCAWPNPAAPFRLLALADPQIEGDKKQKSWRGRIDIWGNDRYLRHVHRSALRQILPEATHEVVLGDLFGSQWIPDDEFYSRAHRYGNIIFRDRLHGQLYGVDRFMNITGNHDIGYGGELSPDRLNRWEHVFGPSNAVYNFSPPNVPPLRIVLFNSLNLDSPATDRDLQIQTHNFLSSLLPEDHDVPIPQTVLLTHLPLYRGGGVCSDAPRFEYWALNITDETGNVTGYFRPIKHQNHLSRWASDWILETVFGDEDEGVILGGHDHEGCDVLHKRLSDEEQELSWDANAKISPHDELKRRQIDDDDDEEEEEEEEEQEEEVGVGGIGGGVESAREENFDFVRPIQTPSGEEPAELHPLEMDQFKFHARNNLSHGIWRAEKYSPGKSGIREITVRSMMGDFNGNVGLLTAQFNRSSQLWEFEYASCAFVVQHWWWVVHIWDCVCIIWIIGYITRPLWWTHWQRKGRPALEWGVQYASEVVETALETWGLLARGRKRQDTEQGGRKRM